MSATTNPIIPSKKDHCGLQRPRYSAGLLLRDDDLGLAVDYTRDLSRLLFRSLVGCGVVCGLKVSAVEKCGKLQVSVARGVALDCHGNPIQVCGDVAIAKPLDCDEPRPACYWVLLRYSEKCCGPRTAMCASEEDEAASSSVCTRELDGYEIAITDVLPSCACGCFDPERQSTANFDCYDKQKKGECGCACGGDCDDDCDCQWVVLARVCFDAEANKYDEAIGGIAWTVSHRFRRYVRPVLAKDPLLASEGGALNVRIFEVGLSLFDREDFRQAFLERLEAREKADAAEAAEAAKKAKSAAKKK